jgi:hypothetical protein
MANTEIQYLKNEIKQLMNMGLDADSTKVVLEGCLGILLKRYYEIVSIKRY